MLYSTDISFVLVVIVLISSATIFFITSSLYFDVGKQTEIITELEQLLKAEKEYQGTYPNQLKDLIRKTL